MCAFLEKAREVRVPRIYYISCSVFPTDCIELRYALLRAMSYCYHGDGEKIEERLKEKLT